MLDIYFALLANHHQLSLRLFLAILFFYSFVFFFAQTHFLLHIRRARFFISFEPLHMDSMNKQNIIVRCGSRDEKKIHTHTIIMGKMYFDRQGEREKSSQTFHLQRSKNPKAFLCVRYETTRRQQQQ